MKLRWMALLILLLSVSAYAQRGIGGTTATVTQDVHKYGIIVGVDAYEDNGISSLKCAASDARGVFELLKSAPGGFKADDMVLLADGEGPDRRPTRGIILRYLKSYIALAMANDTILVYFAGHGTALDGKMYLLPADASLSLVKESGIAYSMITDMLDKSPAKRKVVLLDACHSGTGRSTDTLSRETYSQIEQDSEGTVVLASCGPAELSYEMENTGHGAFTYFLMDGLTGSADSDGDGLVGASELSIYTFEQTRRWAAQKGLTQTPWRMERVAGDIVLARAGGNVPKVSKPKVPSPSSIVSSQPAQPAAVVSGGPLSGTWKWETPFALDGGPVTFGNLTLIQDGENVTIDYGRPSYTKGNLNFAHMECTYQDGVLRGLIQTSYKTRGIVVRTAIANVSFELRLEGNVLSGQATTKGGASSGGTYSVSGRNAQEVTWTRVQ